MHTFEEKRRPNERVGAEHSRRHYGVSFEPMRESEPSRRLQRSIGNYKLEQLLDVRGGDSTATSAAPAISHATYGSGFSKLMEDEGAPEPDDEYRRLQGGGSTPDAGVSDAGVPTTLSASISVTGDGSYIDTATESNKNIKFNVTWSGGSKENYIIVNWVKGYMKDKNGHYFKATLYDSPAEINFADYQVDSVDRDPAYWSSGGVRWRYNVDGANKFSATDNPGPMKTSDGTGAVARLDFRTAVYKSSDVPITTSGSLSATPLSSFASWSYYAKVVPQNYVEINPPLKFDHT